MPNVNDYRSYRDLPPLAGLATIAEAAKPGLSVAECVARLKRYHYALVRLHEIFTARITAEPIYELKTGFSHHAYLCAEHVQALRNRVAEMREPPLGLDEVPSEALQIFFDEILAAPGAEALLLGIYEEALPALEADLEKHLRDTNPLVDAPTVRIIRFALLELADMIEFGNQCTACLVGDKARHEIGPWLELLAKCWRSQETGDRSQEKKHEETATVSEASLNLLSPDSCLLTPLERHFSKTSYQFDPVPRRDERFQDLWNQGVNAEAFIYDPELPAQPKALMMLFKRLREIDVPEMMAGIIVQTKGKPWEYYRAMSRQLWDEARHAMMGEVGFVALGVDWTKARITHNWSYRLNTECTPLERHAVLYFIEQGLMTKTGKRFEWELGRDCGFPLIATIQDYDWADEVLHAQLGREWYIPAIGEWKEALAYGDQCWSRILSNWQTVKDKGLTQHANWWPEVYREACRAWGVAPDAKTLAFDQTYEGARADLKGVGASG